MARRLVFEGNRSRFLSGAVCCLAALYVWMCWPAYRGGELSQRSDLPSLRYAARIEPSNAESQFRLASALFFAGEDVPEARRLLERAVAITPYRAQYWLILAMVYRYLGETAKEADALQSALRREPTSPLIAWQVANFDIVRGDVPSALSLLRVVVQYKEDPGWAESAISLAWSISDGNVQSVLDRTIPDDARAEFILLRVLLDHHASREADRVWQRISSRPQRFDPSLAYPYIDSLISAGKVEQASRAWDYVVRTNPSFPAADASGNLVRDGEFEFPLQAGGFGWRLGAPLYNIHAGIDSSRYHSANHSLSISYDAVAAPDAGVYQMVPLHGGACYEISAYIKTEELQGAHGLRLRVTDAYRAEPPLYESDEFQGTSAWEPLTGKFRTRPDTKLVVIRFSVPEGKMVKGDAWVDDVRLAPAELQSCSMTTSQNQNPQ